MRHATGDVFGETSAVVLNSGRESGNSSRLGSHCNKESVDDDSNPDKESPTEFTNDTRSENAADTHTRPNDDPKETSYSSIRSS